MGEILMGKYSYQKQRKKQQPCEARKWKICTIFMFFSQLKSSLGNPSVTNVCWEVVILMMPPTLPKRDTTMNALKKQEQYRQNTMEHSSTAQNNTANPCRNCWNENRNQTLTRTGSLRSLKALYHVTLGLWVPHVIRVTGEDATLRHCGLAWRWFVITRPIAGSRHGVLKHGQRILIFTAVFASLFYKK